MVIQMGSFDLIQNRNIPLLGVTHEEEDDEGAADTIRGNNLPNINNKRYE